MIKEIIKPTSETYTIRIPKEYINKEVEIIVLSKENEEYELWSEEEIKNFGKYVYGLSSDDFDDDNEDYSKW